MLATVKMMNLDDKIIRKFLIARLASLSKKPKAVIEELRVHNGNAIADVVAIHKYAHCYEIKGDTDAVRRILTQRKYYDLAFRRITLVTTDRHLENALSLAPGHWGIMVASESRGSVAIRYARRATQNPLYDTRVALLTLWKSELLEVALPISPKKLNKLNRAQLTDFIALNVGQEELCEQIGHRLADRFNYAEKFLNM
ncbi:sce7726 family protein [Burkholderia gladioli]|uniref:sce7726 family protein n=1 Tax=Burkholderia gladioli TaxID=28095 RepID=UPI0023643F5E|nr:sce7726 family protein [Burkholderia gladioli]MDD1790421.1 sce7726 family protein [Burkholderia gladioli]